MLLTVGFVLFALGDTFALWRVHRRVCRMEAERRGGH